MAKTEMTERGAEAGGAPREMKMFVGGGWCEAEAGGRIDVFDPATNELIATVPRAELGDVDRAVAAARCAFDGGRWSRVDARDRSRLMLRMADALRRDRDRLAELEVRQMGKTLAGALWDVDETAFLFEYYAGWATKITGEVPPVGPTAMSMIVPEPVGVAALITPWNFPILMAGQKVAPALAAGCAAILKPASETPLTSLALGDIAEEVELPPGALNVITGSGSVAGMGLVRHPGVDKISFTGSVEVGKTIMREASESLKRLTLELGGKNPSIVFADADFDAAIAGITKAVFFNQGQVCGSCSRTFVQDDILEETLDAVTRQVANLRPGSGLDADVNFGPLISRAQVETVQAYIDSGREQGARVAAEGALPSDPRLQNGNFVRPTVFRDVRPEMRIAREEIFGPVMSVMSFDDAGGVAALANDTAYGLTASIWTRDIGKALTTARALRAGTVWINDVLQAPSEGMWGGFKQSGIGRELGRAGLEAFLELKQIYIQTG